MIHIQPISEKAAFGDTKIFYDELKDELKLPSVPTYFQLIAPFHNFLVLLWQRFRPIINTPTFWQETSNLNTVIRNEAAREIPTSPLLDVLVPKIPDQDKSQMTETFQSLQSLNTKLVLTTILVREAIKGLPQTKKEEFLVHSGYGNQAATKELILLEIEGLNQNDEQNSLMRYGGDNPYYSVYMKLVADLMKSFGNSKEYLSLRLFLETTTQAVIRALPPISLTYHDVLTALGGAKYADELVFLLHDSFPGYYPKQLISSILLELCLYPRNPSVALSPKDDILSLDS